MTAPVVEDPFAPLTEDETAQAAYVATVGGANAVTTAAIAAALGGAFLVYRAYLQRRLRDRMDQVDTSDPNAMAREVHQAMRSFMPAWSAMVGPVLLRGYLNGISETGLVMDSRFLTDLADNYAYSLGQHINDVSAEALVKGYAAQVNRKVPAKVALANVVDAFGVTSRTGRALNNILSSKEDAKFSETLMPSVKKLRSRQLIATSIKRRADTIGEQEAWNAHEQGKQIVWMYAMRQGLIPETATRTWVTAEDEKVCPYCGPMHEVSQIISEPFEMPDGKKLWSPPVHPHCRCEAKLDAHLGQLAVQRTLLGGFQRQWITEDEPQVALAKALDFDPKEHPRSQRNGRFVEAGHADPAEDLQAMVRDAELNSLLNGPAKKTLRTPGKSLAAPKKTLKRELKPAGGKTLRAGGGLKGSGLGRAGMNRPKINHEIDRGALERHLRMAQAREDGRILARHDDITLDETEVTETPSYSDLQATDVPMYAIIDHEAVRDVNPGSTKPKGRYFRLDGGEVVGHLDYLADKLKEMEVYRDATTVEEYYDYADYQEMFQLHGIRPTTMDGEFDLPPMVMADLIRYVRHKQETGGTSILDEDRDMYVELPVMGYLDSEGEIVTDDDPRWSEDGQGYGDNGFDPDYEEIGGEAVGIDYLIDALDLEGIMESTKPQIVRLNKVRDNDVSYDARGIPYASPADTYVAAEPVEVTIRGRRYDGYHIEPAWDE